MTDLPSAGDGQGEERLTQDENLVFFTPDERKGVEWAIGRGLHEARIEASAWPFLKDNVTILESARAKLRARAASPVGEAARVPEGGDR
jgi:hypothetical protein